MKLVSDEVNKLLRNVLKKQHPILSEIMMNWGSVVGGKFSSNSVPWKIMRAKESRHQINILYIMADNSSVAMELAYQHNLIIERITIYLGYKAIHKVKIVQK